MVQLTTEQRVFVVSIYLETKSFLAVKDAFRRRFPERNCPCNSTIRKNVEKYRQHGTSLNLNKQFSGRRKSVRTPENIEMVRDHLQENPQVSVRRNGLGLHRSSLHRIIKHDLHWHPYKMHIRHQLKAGDFPRRLQFSRWFQENAPNPRFLNRVVIGDEAAFHMNGKVNTHNVRMYAPQGNNPDFNYDVNSSREKISVWAGICGNGSLLGPFFFERNVTGLAYLRVLNEQVFPAIQQAYANEHAQNALEHVWWFQDGAPAHRLRAVRDRLNVLFDRRLVALGTEVEWPPRSPDLTPMDFFLWGYVKGKIYLTPPENIQELRQRIILSFTELRQNRDFIVNSVREMRRRVELCIQNNGHHVE